jgi:hypothetical protein
MAKAELLTLSSLLGLFSLQGAYLLAYAWLFGMCKCTNSRLDRLIDTRVSLALWVTFFGVCH